MAKSSGVESHQKPFGDDYVDPRILLTDAAGIQADAGRHFQQELSFGAEPALSEI